MQRLYTSPFGRMANPSSTEATEPNQAASLNISGVVGVLVIKVKLMQAEYSDPTKTWLGCFRRFVIPPINIGIAMITIRYCKGSFEPSRISWFMSLLGLCCHCSAGKLSIQGDQGAEIPWVWNSFVSCWDLLRKGMDMLIYVLLEVCLKGLG